MTLPSHPTNTPSICFAFKQCYRNLINVLFVSKSYTWIGGLVGGFVKKMRGMKELAQDMQLENLK
jgi:hypothetical protein